MCVVDSLGNAADASNIYRDVHSVTNDLKSAEIAGKDVKAHQMRPKKAKLTYRAQNQYSEASWTMETRQG